MYFFVYKAMLRSLKEGPTLDLHDQKTSLTALWRIYGRRVGERTIVDAGSSVRRPLQ